MVKPGSIFLQYVVSQERIMNTFFVTTWLWPFCAWFWDVSQFRIGVLYIVKRYQFCVNWIYLCSILKNRHELHVLTKKKSFDEQFDKITKIAYQRLCFVFRPSDSKSWSKYEAGVRSRFGCLVAYVSKICRQDQIQLIDRKTSSTV